MTRGFVGGLIAGGLVGVAVGMMLMPESGMDTARRMADGSREIGMRARRLLNRAQTKSREMMAEDGP